MPISRISHTPLLLTEAPNRASSALAVTYSALTLPPTLICSVRTIYRPLPLSAVNITPLMFQCAAQSPDRQRRQARRASRPAAAVSMLCVSCSAVQQPFSLSLTLKMFVYYRGDTFKAGWGTSQVSLVIIKSAKKHSE